MKRIYWGLLALVPLGATLLLGTRPSAGPDRAAMQPLEAGQRVRAEGRIVTYPGAEVVLSAEARGRIVTLDLDEKSVVRAGQTVLELDSSEQEAALREARAAIAEAEVAVAYEEKDFVRKEQLWHDKVVSDDVLDQVRRERDGAVARRAAAEATLARLASTRAKCRVISPIDGVVLERVVDPGEMVQPGDPLLRIADLSRLRVEAEVDEYDAHRVQVGSTVEITVEGAPGKIWAGTVEEVPDAVTLRRLRPQDPGRPTDTGVLLVKVAFREPCMLKLGQRVEVAVAAAQP
ncbi:MAG: efflux RND transporter periplasmic adaptor subunit [Candidatus Eisenbacteria bacterium]